jgi:hypothetical protein
LARGIEKQWRKEIASEPESRPSDVIEVVDLAARIEVVTKAEAVQVFTGELERCQTLQGTAALLQWNTSWINKLSADDEERLNDIVVARQEVFTADPVRRQQSGGQRRRHPWPS